MNAKHEKQMRMREDELRRLYEETGMRTEPGWYGAFTRRNVPGAIPAGSRIVKQNSEPGDTNADGVPGVVLGSLVNPENLGMVLYFVEWAASPRRATVCADFKIRRANV